MTQNAALQSPDCISIYATVPKGIVRSIGRKISQNKIEGKGISANEYGRKKMIQAVNHIELIEIKYLQQYSCMHLLSCMERHSIFNILHVTIRGRNVILYSEIMIHRPICKGWDEIIIGNNG